LDSKENKMAATVTIDPLEIFKAYMAYDLWKRQQEQQKFAPTQELVKERGWQGAGEALGGEKPLIDLWSHMFGKKTPLPQQTTWQTQTTPTPEGGLSVAPTQPRTRIQWPSPTSAQMLEQGRAGVLSQPGMPETVAKEELLGTQMQRELSKRIHIADFSKGASDVEQAMQYWEAVINGKQPSVDPPTPYSKETERDIAEKIAIQIRPLIGKNVKDLPPSVMHFIDAARVYKVIKIQNGVIQETEAEVTEPKAPKGDWFETKPGIEEYHEWSPETKGWVPSGKTRARWKPEGGITPTGQMSSLQRAYDDEIAELRIRYGVSADPITKMIFFRKEEQKEPYFDAVKVLQNKYNAWSKKMTKYPMFPEEEEKKVETPQTKINTPFASITKQIQVSKTKEEALRYLKRSDVREYMKKYNISEEDIFPMIWEKFIEKGRAPNMP
jgi:hypothetical protein